MSNQRIEYKLYSDDDPSKDRRNATCLPISAHILELTFSPGPVWRIICSEKGCIRNIITCSDEGCTRQLTGYEDGECWLVNWLETHEEEMIYYSDVSVKFSLSDPDKAEWILPVMQPENIVEFRDERYGSVGFWDG